MMHTHRDSTSWDFDEGRGEDKKKKIELFYLIKIYARLFVRWQDSRQDILGYGRNVWLKSYLRWDVVCYN